MICTRCGKLCETLWQRDDYQLCEPCVIVYLNAQGIISRVADNRPTRLLKCGEGFP